MACMFRVLHVVVWRSRCLMRCTVVLSSRQPVGSIARISGSKFEKFEKSTGMVFRQDPIHLHVPNFAMFAIIYRDFQSGDR